ncbi:RagB/SusD family nutrient uptake outer membrane protein [Reichenbachiella carrageenanivorans]|uniref:RagB/SusD family nutrient uptake outer membrane protein n=1 Tax=Reichenbachiella carrageenanivorans TaxID=2979869 RepID=A0ABY6CYI4_9BACT|nr:RagB/SusD family nutrient uptake outer membrane protein [Reichenbachiella carrageenanivorans]UXX78789.1 RagB/SusD family nutrient uptake outer membrane protein [Reichenbachiella carrageenanivorans]
MRKLIHIAPKLTKVSIRITLVCLSVVWLPACDSYLEEVPDDRVSLDDLDKAAQLVTNAYSDASYAFTDWMTDDFTYTIGTNLRPAHEQMYLWQDPTSDPEEQDTPGFFWYQTYNAISHANEVLQIIDDLEVDEEDEARRDAIKGEALLARAYGHFMLVNLFSEDNFIFKNGLGLGVPYIESPETEFLVEYKRPSVKKTYEEIEDDLKLGLELIDDRYFTNSGKYHFNKNAALAFASRFYLFKGDFIRSLQYSDELLGANPEAYVRDMTSELFRSAKASTTGYPQLYNSTDLASNLLLIRKVSLFQRTDYAFGVDRNDYGSLFATTIFDDVTDERENPAWVKGLNALFPVRYESLFQRSSINSNVGTPYHIAIAFRGEEVLLNRAECYIQLGRNDDAIADLQVLIDRRFTGDDVTLSMARLRTFYPASWTDFGILYEYLILTRQKEFLAQGMRWFDLKRFQVPVEHYGPDGNVIGTLEGDDKRKVLQLPNSAVEVGGLEGNDR